MHSTRRPFGFSALPTVLLFALATAPAFAQWTPDRLAADESELPRTPWGAPDFQGVWNNSTTTPLERLTSEEQALSREARQAVIAATRGTGAGWLEQAGNIERESLIIDPPDGRIRMAEQGVQRLIDRENARAGRGEADSWRDRNNWERCISRTLPTAMIPTLYNANYQIFQTPDHFVLLMEMIHEARIVPLDGAPHASGSIRQWLGDGRGRWEGDTLVVETLHFNGKLDGGDYQPVARHPDRAPRIGGDPAAHRALHAGRRQHHRLPGDGGGSADLRRALHRGHPDAPLGARRHAVRVRLPRGEPRDGEPAQRRARRRAAGARRGGAGLAAADSGRAPRRAGAGRAVRADTRRRPMSIRTIFETCHPRADVLQGTVAEADFAADLAQVVTGKGSAEYVDAARFFANTYPTRGLRNLLADVCRRLSGARGERPRPRERRS